jgi:hypothetical protein
VGRHWSFTKSWKRVTVATAQWEVKEKEKESQGGKSEGPDQVGLRRPGKVLFNIKYFTFSC